MRMLVQLINNVNNNTSNSDRNLQYLLSLIRSLTYKKLKHELQKSLGIMSEEI